MIGKAKLFFYGRVKDNDDIFGLNRVRVFPETDDVIERILKKTKSELLDNPSSPTDIIDSAKFTIDDPFVFYPLLPPYMSFIPKKGEMVWVTYSMLGDKQQRKEQFYIPGPKTSPFNISFEEYDVAKSNTSQGFNTKTKPALKSSTPDSSGINFWSPSHLYGIWAEPGDNAIYGQGTTDLILKRDEILLRAGKKSTMVSNDIPGKQDRRNLNLGFLQISNYTTKAYLLSEEQSTTNEIDESPLKFLIEYELENPENIVDVYNGTIRLLEISKANLRNNEFTSSTPVDPAKSTQYWSYQFRLEPMNIVISIINDVINGLNEGKIVITGTSTSSATTLTLCDDVDADGNCGYCGRCFPFYYRPNSRMKQILFRAPNYADNPYAFAELISVSKMVSAVRFTRAFDDFNGDGLVSKKDKFGVSKKKKKFTNIPQVFAVEPNSVSILGSNKIILYSQDSQIEDKKITLSGDSIYGVTQPQVFKELIPKTDAMVRGDKLKEVLNLMMKFMVTHCHAYHGTPPNPISFSQVSVSQIEQEFQKYDDKVLNQNIRIN
jgi:hypothetical protein